MAAADGCAVKGWLSQFHSQASFTVSMATVCQYVCQLHAQIPLVFGMATPRRPTRQVQPQVSGAATHACQIATCKIQGPGP